MIMPPSRAHAVPGRGGGMGGGWVFQCGARSECAVLLPLSSFSLSEPVVGGCWWPGSWSTFNIDPLPPGWAVGNVPITKLVRANRKRTAKNQEWANPTPIKEKQKLRGDGSPHGRFERRINFLHCPHSCLQASWSDVPSVLCTCSLLVHVGTSSGLSHSPGRSSSAASGNWGSGDGRRGSRVRGSRGSRGSWESGDSGVPRAPNLVHIDLISK